jgi:phosphoribosylanthranilate isomerase
MIDSTPASRRPARTRVKICGITTVDDALLAAALGADAIGLVLAPRSPRRVDIATAAAIRAALPPFVDTVALFMDQPADDVRAVLDAVRPGWAQFHGGEDDETCAAFGWPYLKAVAMGGQGEDAAALPASYPRARGFLFDGHARGEAGGSGKTFDWTRIPADFAPPFFVAGGLSPDNVFAAIRASGCWGVDVSSGVEAAPGRKDPERLRRFFAEVGRADGIL